MPCRCKVVVVVAAAENPQQQAERRLAADAPTALRSYISGGEQFSEEAT